MTTDKTGAPTTVTAESDRFSISVEGHRVGFVEFTDRGGQRIFTHTEVAAVYGGRGLASILVDAALRATRDAGLRIVAVCPMVAGFVDKHHEFADVVDPVSRDIKSWLASSKPNLPHIVGRDDHPGSCDRTRLARSPAVGVLRT